MSDGRPGRRHDLWDDDEQETPRAASANERSGSAARSKGAAAAAAGPAPSGRSRREQESSTRRWLVPVAILLVLALCGGGCRGVIGGLGRLGGRGGVVGRFRAVVRRGGHMGHVEELADAVMVAEERRIPDHPREDRADREDAQRHQHDGGAFVGVFIGVQAAVMAVGVIVVAMPVPVMMIEKGWFITSIPISTPVVERTTARRTSSAL